MANFTDESMVYVTVDHGVRHGSPHGLTHGRCHGLTIEHTTACPMARSLAYDMVRAVEFSLHHWQRHGTVHAHD